MWGLGDTYSSQLSTLCKFKPTKYIYFRFNLLKSHICYLMQYNNGEKYILLIQTAPEDEDMNSKGRNDEHSHI